MKTESIKNELLKNGGLTLTKELEKATEKKGYYVSKIGYEKIIQVEELENYILQYKELLAKNEYIGLWIDNNKIYIDISKHYKDKKQALKIGIKNKQLAIYDIKNDKSIYLLKDTYILYKYNNIKNDIQYIKEYYNIKDLIKDFNIKNIYQYIYNNINNLESIKKINDRYIIIKDKMLYKDFMELMEG